MLFRSFSTGSLPNSRRRQGQSFKHMLQRLKKKWIDQHNSKDLVQSHPVPAVSNQPPLCLKRRVLKYGAIYGSSDKKYQVISISVCFISTYYFLQRTITLPCNIFTQDNFYAIHGHAYRGPVYINAPADSPVRTTLQHRGSINCPSNLK